MQKAIDLIKLYEKLMLEAYIPPEGTANGWAIGYGYTRPWVSKGCRISPEWAVALLLEQIRDVHDILYRHLLPEARNVLTSNQRQALVSFIYNVGEGSFAMATLRKKLNAGLVNEAADELLKWNKAFDPKTGKKVVLPGLVKRREAERKLFLTPDE